MPNSSNAQITQRYLPNHNSPRDAAGWLMAEGLICASAGGVARGSVDRFNQGDTLPSLARVADWMTVLLYGLHEVFEDRFVSSNVTYHVRGCTLILERSFVRLVIRPHKGRGNNAVILENYSSFRTCNFNAAWIPRVSGRGGQETANRAIRKFEDCQCRIFNFNRVLCGSNGGLDF